MNEKKYEEALNKFSTPPDTASTDEWCTRTYLRGVSQLFLAMKNNDPNLIKNAGISFMSVVIEHPENPLAGACLMETGLVHQMINRHDLAGALYERASIQINAQNEPELANRLSQLLATMRRARGLTR